jgi:hypothetical protein
VIRYKLTVKIWTVHVALDATNADQYVPLSFEGKDHPIDLVREHLLRSHGMDGHLIEEKTTPLDLDMAMSSPFMKQFSPELVEGGEILKTSKRRGNP